MTTQRFVRSARSEDIDEIVEAQVASWRDAYREAFPPAVLSEMTGEEAGGRFRERWREAVEHPPTPRHRLLVATDEGRVAGFTAFGPAGDPDLWPRTDAELYALHVHPRLIGRGHGSRMLNAAVDYLLDDGFGVVHLWVLREGDPLRSFAEAAGWRPDGARRELDLGAAVPMIRLRAAIGG
ncbi:N-acetyltransferase family protein [Marinactinospora thermotolerans]|uniref:Ribosomal protein S18 acetylase RimI n=1 Tax=Marinactinospora thermotolerans DSM 45154 TaxID=1122192 RepID=A0A1T4LI82_9ACTN|nr:GNAT family N-acetyltransferase [Marinactinospora thermotolerans]SJZ54472.1 Ribosomal protein S18 acetylase RimI [Marinactinospora thermotolerans DSM 45154]